MNETSRSNSRTVLWISIIVAFIAGFFVGLVIFGWNLTPVEWANGNMAIVSDADKARFLRAAIDSYAYRGEAIEALASYNSLGENKAQILAQIYANPIGQNTQDIEAFAAAVGASQALSMPPAATGQPASTAEPGEEANAPAAPASGVGGWLKNPLLLGGAICAVLVIAVLLAVILLAIGRGRSRAQAPVSPDLPQTPVGDEILQPTSATGTGAASTDIPDWLKPANEEDPFQTVRLEEAGLAQVFEQESEIDLAATPPRGLHLDDIAARPEDTPAAEFTDELTDEDIAALSAQDFSTRMPQPGATAFIDESAATEGAAGLPGEDQAWLEGEPETELDEAAWLDAQRLEEPAAADEPTPEQMAPFEGEAPSFVADSPEEDFGAPEPAEMLDLEEADVDETPEETYAKFSQDIASIAGISTEEAARLRAIGITVPLLLLKKGATPEGRQQIADQANLDPYRLFEWVNDADLFRVKGIDQDFAALLEAAGVDTIADLAASNTQDLYRRLRSAAGSVAGLRRLPSQGTVEGWIAQAKKLPRSVS